MWSIRYHLSVSGEGAHAARMLLTEYTCAEQHMRQPCQILPQAMLDQSRRAVVALHGQILCDSARLKVGYSLIQTRHWRRQNALRVVGITMSVLLGRNLCLP